VERYFSRFSLQSKVMIFFAPLIAVILAVGVVNYVASSALRDRILATGGIFRALTGFKDIYSSMARFLRVPDDDGRMVVLQRLAEQETALADLIREHSNASSQDQLADVKTGIASIEGDVESLWVAHTAAELNRKKVEAGLGRISQVQVQLIKHAVDLAKESRKLEKTQDSALTKLLANLESLPEIRAAAGDLRHAIQAATASRKLSESVSASVRKLTDSLYSVRISATRFMAFADDANREQLLESFDQAQNDMQVLRAVGRGNVHLEEASSSLLSIMNTMEADTRALIAITRERLERFARAEMRIEQSWSSLRLYAEEQKAEAQDQSVLSNLIMLLAITVGIVGALLAGIGLVMTLKRPISSITAAMLNLAAGKVDTDVPGGQRADEVGDMARAMEVFKKNAVRKIEAETEAEHQRLAADDQRRRHDASRIEIETQIDMAVRLLGEGLELLAAGNLGANIDMPLYGNLEALRRNFNDSIAQLSETMAVVRCNGAIIQENGIQLAGVSEELARRTETQAASLEQTAAAVNQISTTVHDTADLASSADALVQDTAERTEASNTIVRSAVAAMERIEQASAQIHDIIDLIDDIAFQTNLLALNAGIEAARAGEAGKGFSVVAQEVRDLSQRSAEAANRIKALIAHSTAEVRQGALMVQRTDTVLTEIHVQFSEIRNHVRKIAQASRVQSDGLREINSALASMDSITQQNAAMVEETSAASANLEASAGELMRSLHRFRISADDKGAPERRAA
jgi:methyl-accepting chemotaxis protein